MDTAVEIKGYWWLPETPDNQVSGTLTFSPGKSISLELMGVLNERDDFVSPMRALINPPIICGEGAAGEKITLEDCKQVGVSVGGTGITTTAFRAQYVYVGAHFSSQEQIRFRSLSISFQYLDEWFSKQGFTSEHPSPESLVVTYKQPLRKITSIGEYYIDFIIVGPSSSQDHFTHINISQKAVINILSETEKGMDQFLLLVGHIQNFLSLAISEPTFITGMTGNTESAKEENPTFYNPVKIYYLSSRRNTDSIKIQYFDMMFTLPTVEDQLETMLRNWISKAEIIKPVYDLYFSTLYNPSIYQEFKFLSLAQAVETYHRQIYGGQFQSDKIFQNGLYKAFIAAIPSDIPDDFRKSLVQGKLKYANEFSLRKRLQLLAEHISENLHINFLSDKKLRVEFADKVTDTRNYLTHYPPELQEKAAKSGPELRELIQKLRLILQICFLEELGLPYDKINEIFRKKREYRDNFL